MAELLLMLLDSWSFTQRTTLLKT
ncbi:hypothetical protein MTR67_018659 [Solanum verrucosum]|uniref:Uncharacterized protein n=1 Tax=Solanum verrucosum TaxID=315347 RepID=A0AAF0QK30_SOLVR|nr:hypothetical protein MTR67_018659 [Solanum verrucosum]